jgi:S1-C subfamily serine protease
LIVAVDGTPIGDVDALQRALGADAIDRSLEIEIVRRDRKLTVAALPRESRH